MHLAVLHDHREATRPDQDRRIGKRIAVDEEKIGERAGLHDAESERPVPPDAAAAIETLIAQLSMS